jgi:WD40 repeat protein
VTICDLERALARLKLAEFFSFDQAELNEGWGQWDVFPDVDDPDAFEPADEGNAHAFLWWSREAGRVAFDAEGVLRHPLPMVWGGSLASLQMAFARGGLTVRIEADEEARASYGESGRVVLSPRSAAVDCDLRVILRAFAALRERGVVALANAGYTRSDGWSEVADDAKDAATTAVFWTEQAHDAFDGVGNLAAPLFLYWRGDAEALVDGLRAAGLTVHETPPPERCIEVTSGPAGSVDLETFERAVREVAAAHTASGGASGEAPRTAETRVRAAHAGPVELERSFCGAERKPVRWLTFDPHRATRLALALDRDGRGAPTSPGYIVELATNAVEQALLADTPVMGVGGMRLLRDGRLLFCTTQYLGPDDPRGSSCLVLHCRAPGQAGLDEILIQPFSHISDTSLLTFDDEERFAVLGQPNGALVYDVPARGAPWPEPRRLHATDPAVDAAYTRTAISPDGTCVVWCDDWSQPMICLERESGDIRWAHEPANEARWRPRFAPDSRTVALIVGRDEERRVVRFYSAATGEAVLADLTAATAGVKSFAFHPGGRILAVGRADGVVTLLDCADGRRLAEEPVLAKGYVSALEFDASGDHLAVGGSKGDVALFRCREALVLSAASVVPAPAPARRIPSFAARKKGHPLIGARGRLVDFMHYNEPAIVRSVSADGTKLRVVVTDDGYETKTSVALADFRSEADAGRVSPACPFQVGDTIFVHDGWNLRGRAAVVEDVDEATARVFVACEEDQHGALAFADITLVRPARRDPLPDYVAAVERVRWLGRTSALIDWCVEQLARTDWDPTHPTLAPGTPLAEEFAALERSVRDAATREHEACMEELRERFEPLTREERAELWQREWQRWVGWRERPTPKALAEDKDRARQQLRAVWALRERIGIMHWD